MGGMCQDDQQPGDHCNHGSEEEWSLHNSRSLPPQDPHKASHKSRCQEHLWQRRQGQGQASKDRGESIPSVCVEETNLSVHECISLCLSRGWSVVGIPQSRLGKHSNCCVASGKQI